MTASVIRVWNPVPAIAQIFFPIARPPVPTFLVSKTAFVLILAFAARATDQIFMAFLDRVKYFFLERH
jgi:hypothetical protein